MKRDSQLSQSLQMTADRTLLGRIAPEVFEGFVGVEESALVKQRYRLL
jgi:hypothetical protein